MNKQNRSLQSVLNQKAPKPTALNLHYHNPQNHLSFHRNTNFHSRTNAHKPSQHHCKNSNLYPTSNTQLTNSIVPNPHRRSRHWPTRTRTAYRRPCRKSARDVGKSGCPRSTTTSRRTSTCPRAACTRATATVPWTTAGRRPCRSRRDTVSTDALSSC